MLFAGEDENENWVRLNLINFCHTDDDDDEISSSFCQNDEKDNENLTFFVNKTNQNFDENVSNTNDIKLFVVWEFVFFHNINNVLNASAVIVWWCNICPHRKVGCEFLWCWLQPKFTTF